MKRFLLVLTLCCVNLSNAQTKQSKVIVIDHSLIAVFNISDAWMFTKCKPATLTTRDYLDIERLVTQCLDEYNSEQRKKIKEYRLKYPADDIDESQHIIDWKLYKKQYCPAINEKGEKEIWINCFCDFGYHDGWKESIVTVSDGGKCYFNLKVNLSQKTYYHLSVNGFS